MAIRIQEMISLYCKEALTSKMAINNMVLDDHRKENKQDDLEKKKRKQFDIMSQLTPFDFLNMARYRLHGPLNPRDVLYAFIFHEMSPTIKEARATENVLEAIAQTNILS